MNQSACRISYTDRRNSWCGSGGIAGYDEDGSALILTNAHVSGSPSVAATRIARFKGLNGGRDIEHDASEIVAYGFSERLAVDWAILKAPTLRAESGYSATKLLRTNPAGAEFSFTGSPRCIWPQTHIDVRLVEGVPADGVRFWQPTAIGGQSGSNLRAMINGQLVTQLLLTWSWNGNGAGQETSQIYNNIINANTDGPERPEGLVEASEFAGRIDAGYFECDAFASRFRENRLQRVRDLPIWFDENDTTPVDPELSECERLVIELQDAIKAQELCDGNMEEVLKRVKEHGQQS